MKNEITAENSREELLHWFFENADANPLVTSLYINPSGKNKSKFIYNIEGRNVAFAEIDSAIGELIIRNLFVLCSRDFSSSKRDVVSADLDLVNEEAVGPAARSLWKLQTLPSVLGVSLALHRQPVSRVRFDDIGFLPSQKDSILKGLKRREGLILVSGPCGSGKTNTIESLIEQFSKIYPNRHITEIAETIEIINYDRDQIEFDRFDDSGKRKSLIPFLKAVSKTKSALIVLNGFNGDEDEIRYMIDLALAGQFIICEFYGSSVEETISRLLYNSDSPDRLAKALNSVICQTLVNLDFDKQPAADSFTRFRTAVAEVLFFNEHLKSHLRRVADARKLVNLARDKDGFLKFSAAVKEKIKTGEQISPAYISYVEEMNC